MDKMYSRESRYEKRYGMVFKRGELIEEETLAKELFPILKEKAPNFRSTQQTLEILGAMLTDCKLG